MLSASVISPLDCRKCGQPLIIDGKLKCLRCKQEVPATLGQKKIFCPYCQKPKMLLAKHGQALCPRKGCRGVGTPMFKKEEIAMEDKKGYINFEDYLHTIRHRPPNDDIIHKGRDVSFFRNALQKARFLEEIEVITKGLSRLINEARDYAYRFPSGITDERFVKKSEVEFLLSMICTSKERSKRDWQVSLAALEQIKSLITWNFRFTGKEKGILLKRICQYLDYSFVSFLGVDEVDHKKPALEILECLENRKDNMSLFLHLVKRSDPEKMDNSEILEMVCLTLLKYKANWDFIQNYGAENTFRVVEEKLHLLFKDKAKEHLWTDEDEPATEENFLKKNKILSENEKALYITYKILEARLGKEEEQKEKKKEEAYGGGVEVS